MRKTINSPVLSRPQRYELFGRYACVSVVYGGLQNGFCRNSPSSGGPKSRYISGTYQRCELLTIITATRRHAFEGELPRLVEGVLAANPKVRSVRLFGS